MSMYESVRMAHVDLKIVMLGKEYCGKTSLVERYLHNRFLGLDHYQNTIGAAYGSKKFTGRDNREYLMGIWDTAGAERYQSISASYYRNAYSAILCYDVTDPDSWNRLKLWVKELNKFEPECRIYIVACKIDLLDDNTVDIELDDLTILRRRREKRKIDYHTTTDYAEEVGALAVIETSSLNNENVDHVFQKIIDEFTQDSGNFISWEMQQRQKIYDERLIQISSIYEKEINDEIKIKGKSKCQC